MPSWKSTTMVPWLAVLAGICAALGWLALGPLITTVLGPQGHKGTHPVAGFEPLLLRTGPDDNPSGGSLTAAGVRADLSFLVKPDGYGGEQQQPVLRLWPAASGDDAPISLLTDTPLLEHMGLPSPVTNALMQMVELDTDNGSPEVLFSQYSGGAHCCALVTIFRENDQGEWQAIDAGAFDGDIFAATEPVPGHGYLLAVVDNRFLYRFSSYTGSSAPLQFLALQGEQVVDVGHLPHLRPLFEKDAQRQAQLLDNNRGGEVNGFLAGYAASHARAGRIEEAWPVVLQRHDRDSQWGLEYCPGEEHHGHGGDCGQGSMRHPNFPSELAALLREAGYISEDMILASSLESTKP
ncbi:MAG: hypothetical protein F4Z75_05175 [Synechococcus sp. SB0668_bin_15]|nr:hypothetical protein [Synechococcus sp. SB0668_bin_15]MXZ83502.1 hypothetical protein [Synechococcus sp. SB0666_bin_14]MYA91204.1 hypothetical protein [Synechococcus sp. SB0663_bin_10]MYC49270.1 hypothetical protein [Synechococcus sp. SB0662_bin_14]MYG47705.1 hypothetical protein [Synechococcus sp. SB0675_bin_6]MYJ60537.1 hypothetical protein [Synechococcus sp. SB0672_bin_6]MYK90847.1 hypothetical protein [Synechococcus sp. SB0669_bin_8]